ncbi:MAG: restriction endonuclease subunit S [Desulfobacterales bacterium]|nr:restriction endonuclease subunit S [Desulfobacterales bacterium]
MSEWKECKLGDMLVFQRGYDLPKTNMKDGSIPVAASNGIIGYHNESTTKGPGITIGRSGNIGIPKYYRTDFWAHNTVLYVKDFKGNDERFSFYFLHGFDLEGLNAGSAVPTLNRNHLYEIPVIIPPIPEQKAIASVLSSLDDKIDLLHRQNKTLEAMAETIFRQWFVEGVNWDGALSEYIKVQGGYAFKSADFKEKGSNGIIKITNISIGCINIVNTQFVDDSIVKSLDSNKFKIISGDILIAMTGAEIGKIGIVEKTKKSLWLNQRVGKLIPNVTYGEYIGYLALKSTEGQDYIINACAGSAQENISSSKLEEMKFVSYSKEKTESFGIEVKPFFEKIIFNQKQIRTLSTLRDTLLPKLMSGEVRVAV